MSRIAISDVGTQLLYKNETAYEVLIGVKTASSPRGEATEINVTELQSPDEQVIKGRRGTKTATFEFNHTEANMEKVVAVCDGEPQDFLLVFDDGTGYSFTGEADYNHQDISTNTAITGVLSVFVAEHAYLKASEVTALKG